VEAFPAIDWSVNPVHGSIPAVPNLDALPRRDAPSGFPVPPARMRLWRDGRPLKRWRYVGLYGDDLMLCAAAVRIAGLPQAFWATWDREQLRERTVFLPGAVRLDGVARFRGAELAWQPDGDAMEVVSRHGDSYIWTRKQPVRARGTVDGRAVDLRGLVDDSAGYHARETHWRWCAGVGEGASGEALAWNLVVGVHDAPAASERTVWVDGAATEPGPVSFAGDLSAVRGDDGSELRFAAEARRARRDDLKVFMSDYEQPFGSFSGTLPGGTEVARGWGVMEHHDVRW
jgi:hypothetical protein